MSLSTVFHARRMWLAVLAVAMAGASCAVPGGDAAGRGGGQLPATEHPSGAPQELWRWNVPSPGSAGMPVVGGPDQQIAFTYGHIALVMLDHEGTQLWQADRVGVRDVAPLITPAAVVVATDEGVAAFDRASGRLLWDSTIGDRANTPVEVGAVLVTTTWDGVSVGLDGRDGSVLWRTLLPGAAIGPPAVMVAAGRSDPVLAVATWNSGLRAGATALAATDGTVVWEVPLPPGGVSAPAVATTASGSQAGSQIVVVVAGDMAAHGLAPIDGQEVWRTELEGSGQPEVQPFVGPGAQVVVGHRLGGISVLDAATGSAHWSASSDGAAVRGGPVAGSQGRVAMPLDDGRILTAGDQSRRELRPAEGRVSGVAVTADDELLVGTRGPQPAAVIAFGGW